MNATILVVAYCCLVIGAGYAVLNVIAIITWRLSRRQYTADGSAPITVLKPLYGDEPGLYGQLRSFCRQDYGIFEVVFGVRDSRDPACSIVNRLMKEFPNLPIKLIINPQLHGTNYKVSNLINMLPHASFDLLVLADSDAFVAPDYLKNVTAPLNDPGIGLVTCVYRGVPTQRVWSRLGAMYINEWYLPTVLVAWLFGHQGYVSGQTICLRRGTLREIGGFEALADHLADDYRMGELVRNLGLRIFLSPYPVIGEHHEPSLKAVIWHELRWMRTLRVLQPASFCGLLLTFSLPLATLGILLAASEMHVSASAWTLFAMTVLARLVLHLAHRIQSNSPILIDLWLLPLRDLLIFCVWCASFLVSRVTWRGSVFDIDSNGIMHRVS